MKIDKLTARQQQHAGPSSSTISPRPATRRAVLFLAVCVILLSAVTLAATPAAPQADQETASSIAVATPPGRVLKVGRTRPLKAPSAAARVARDGDVIEIDAGVYLNDYAHWTQNDLTIRGVGGRAHLMSRGFIPNGKAIWIVGGNNTLIEDIEFSGASVVDNNGAGIRHEGGDLTVNRAFFHGNEFSILSGRQPTATIRVTSSKFWFQKRRNRFSHGIYIGHAKKFVLTGSHFIGTDEGHQIKSRAFENQILYNRIEDIPSGNASRLIDLSNCGFSLVMGNEMHKAAAAENVDAIGFGPEGCADRTEREVTLFAVNNTYVNESPATDGAFVRNHSTGTAIVANNLIFGNGAALVGFGEAKNNIRHCLDEHKGARWIPPLGSAAIDGAAPVGGDTAGFTTIPEREFTAPVGTRARPEVGQRDVGAREWLE